MIRFILVFMFTLSFSILGSSLSSKNLSAIENYFKLNNKKLGKLYIKNIELNGKSKLLSGFELNFTDKKNNKAHLVLESKTNNLNISGDGYFNFKASISLTRGILQQAIIRFNEKQKDYKASLKILSNNRITVLKLEPISDKELDINFISITLLATKSNKYIAFNVYLSLNSKSKYVSILRKTISSIINRISHNNKPKSKDIMVLKVVFNKIKNNLVKILGV